MKIEKNPYLVNQLIHKIIIRSSLKKTKETLSFPNASRFNLNIYIYIYKIIIIFYQKKIKLCYNILQNNKENKKEQNKCVS